MFSQAYVKNSVHRRVYSIMQWAGGVHPPCRHPGQTPPGQTHTLARHSPGQTLPWADTPLGTPPMATEVGEVLRTLTGLEQQPYDCHFCL